MDSSAGWKVCRVSVSELEPEASPPPSPGADDLHHTGGAALNRQSRLVHSSCESVIIILLRGRTHHPTAVVTVTAGQHPQLLQGLLVLEHFGALREETRSHAANVEDSDSTVQLSQPGAESRSRLEGRQDGSRGDQRGCRRTEMTLASMESKEG